MRSSQPHSGRTRVLTRSQRELTIWGADQKTVRWTDGSGGGDADEYAKLARHIAENVYLNCETIRLDGALRFTAKGGR